jgi:hypothetical protein
MPASPARLSWPWAAGGAAEDAHRALREFLEQCERGSPVAVETIGNWYWIVGLSA